MPLPAMSVQPSLPPEFREGAFTGGKAGAQRSVSGIRLCWCPAGQFTIGSPPTEPERRPDEDQVQVTLTKGFWTGKDEVTQGEWRQVMDNLPGGTEFSIARRR